MQRQEPAPITFSIYFNGTSFEMRDFTNFAGFFHEHTQTNGQHLKLGFDGCAIVKGLFTGGIFGASTESQAKAAAQAILDKIHLGHKIKVNCYGHSRGAISALLLAKQLGGFSKDQLEMNLVLLDTVPGNYLWTSTIDATQATFANQALDLSKCKNINHVLNLYPATPLPNLFCHAPLIPLFPSFTQVDTELTPGIHSNTQYINARSDGIYLQPYAYINFIRIKNFFLQHGTLLDQAVCNPPIKVNRWTFQGDEGLKICYEDSLQRLDKETSRLCHGKKSPAIIARPNTDFFNAAHREMVAPNSNGTLATYLTTQTVRRPFQYDYAQPVFSLLLQTLLTRLIEHLPEKSKRSEKFAILTAFQMQLRQKSIANVQEATSAIRNIVAVTLQQQKTTLQNTTDSAKAIKSLLNQSTYAPIKQLILGVKEGKLAYRDLRTFVIGFDVPAYFSQDRKHVLYGLFTAPGAHVLKDYSAYYASRIKFNQQILAQ